MAYNNLANDVSLQQFSELWESSRYSQRLSTDSDRLRHVLEKTEHHMPDLSLCEMSNNRRIRREMESDHRGIRQVDLQPTTDSIGEEGAPVHLAKDGLKDLGKEEDDEDSGKHDSLLPKLGTPSWLSNALMRQAQAQVSRSEGNEAVASSKWCSSCGASSTGGSHCLCTTTANHMQTSTSPSLANHPYTDWLSAVPMVATSHPRDSIAGELPSGQRVSTAPGESTRYNIDTVNKMSENSGRDREHQRVILGLHMESGTGNDARGGHSSNPGGGDHTTQERDENMDRVKNWHEARLKAKMLTHPMFSQMLAAHVGCLRIATPVHHLPKIDEQLSQSQHVIDKYSVFAPEEGEDVEDKDELDDFMRNYTMVLMNMQEQLQNHVRVHATEAMVGCWELEQQLYNLTGVSPGPGSGATMSDDEDDLATESDGAGYETGMDVQDSSGGFGPLVPTETERTLMERVRQELKLELNEGYRDKIVDVREEILRKRRAGKLPEGTTTVLKTWWNAHSKWPYPTEDEKERLIQETGLELKQVNNWFINQRKRNWHSNPLSSSSELKNKRKG